MFFRVILITALSIFSLNATLPKKVQADMYLLKAKKSLEKSDYKTAMQNFEKILKLGVSVPNSFHYFYAKTLYENKMYRKTLKELDIFLNNGGNKSKHYVKSLELYSDTEKKVEEVEAKEAKERQEREAKETKYREIANEFQKEKKSTYSPITGLMWTLPVKKRYLNNRFIKIDSYGLNLKDAYNYCKNLTLKGYNDWRLPTIKDFSTLLPKNRISIINWNKYGIDYSTVFWLKGSSGFRKKPYSNNSKLYKTKYYYKANKILEEKRNETKNIQTVCVRVFNKKKYNEYFKHKYTLFNMHNHKLMLEDSFFIDGKPYIYDIAVNLKQAKSYCQKLKLAGFQDWRVPTKKDMLRYIPCKINRHTYFIYEGENSTELLFQYSSPTLFGNGNPGVLKARECKIYGFKYNKKALIRCVRDVDAPKKTTTTPTSTAKINGINLEDKDP